jgi:hypothetical protein
MAQLFNFETKDKEEDGINCESFLLAAEKLFL